MDVRQYMDERQKHLHNNLLFVDFIMALHKNICCTKIKCKTAQLLNNYGQINFVICFTAAIWLGSWMFVVIIFAVSCKRQNLSFFFFLNHPLFLNNYVTAYHDIMLQAREAPWLVPTLTWISMEPMRSQVKTPGKSWWQRFTKQKRWYNVMIKGQCVTSSRNLLLCWV